METVITIRIKVDADGVIGTPVVAVERDTTAPGTPVTATATWQPKVQPGPALEVGTRYDVVTLRESKSGYSQDRHGRFTGIFASIRPGGQYVFDDTVPVGKRANDKVGGQKLVRPETITSVTPVL